MRKSEKSLLTPTIAYKRDTRISRAVSSVSTKSEYVARSQRKSNSRYRGKSSINGFSAIAETAQNADIAQIRIEEW
jgi:hypothetical protein